MKEPHTDGIHRALDDQRHEADSAELAAYRATLARLEECRHPAPPDLLQRVMTELPPRPEAERPWSRWLDRLAAARRPWLTPVAGALALLLISVGVAAVLRPSGAEKVAVRFELHAPSAQRVELVGTFNDWQPGSLLLSGPDASGHWTATLRLPAGRHEYLFLVDGSEWRADPRAAAYRPDGFGRVNALLEL